MDCQSFKRNLNSLLHKELEGSVAQQAKDHISSCPLCQLEFEKESEFDKTIGHYLVQEEAPFTLREEIIANLNKTNPVAEFFAFNWIKQSLIPLTAAITILLIFGVVARVNTPFPVFAGSVDNHIEMLKGAYPLEIKTSDMDEAIDWFKGKIDFAITRPHIDLSKVNLVGARLVNIGNRKVAYFVYEKDGHQISAFVMNLEGAKLPKVEKDNIIESEKSRVYMTAKKGYRSVLCFHKSDKTGCSIVSDMPQSKIMTLMG